MAEGDHGCGDQDGVVRGRGKLIPDFDRNRKDSVACKVTKLAALGLAAASFLALGSN
jgi:hypothetical protein